MKIRINNLEFRKYTSTKTEKLLYEIIKWYPNVYFEKEEEYKKEGFIDSFGGDFLQKGGSSISKSSFILPESCCVIAFIEKGSESWELRSIGERMLELSSEEWNDFHSVYSLGNTKLNKISKQTI